MDTYNIIKRFKQNKEINNNHKSRLKVNADMLSKVIASTKRLVTSLKRARMSYMKKDERSFNEAEKRGFFKKRNETHVCHGYEYSEHVVSNVHFE